MFVESAVPFFADFAVDVLVAGVSARGIFDNPSATSTGGLGLATTSPKLTLPTSLVPADWSGKPVVIAKTSEAFTITDHEPDGTGMSTLILERA